MDDLTRRQVTWVIIIALGLSLVTYAAHQRSVIPSAVQMLALGDLSQQVAAARTLVLRGKVAESLDGKPRWVQTAAVTALLSLGTPEAVQQLTELIPKLDEPVANWATEALTSLGALAIGPLVECIQNKNGDIRAAAQGPLGKIGGPQVIAAVTPLMGAYDDYVRAAVTAVMAPQGTPAADVAVRRLLQKAPGPDESSAAYSRAQGTAQEILVAMGEPALEPLLTRIAVRPEEKLRTSAALMLGRLGPGLKTGQERVFPPLLKLLEDSSWSVRTRAAWALGELADKAATPEILAALTRHLADTPEVKAAAVRALGATKSPAAAPALVQTLLSRREGVSRELVKAFAALGPAALPALAGALSAADAEAREVAVQAVAQIGTPAAVPILAGKLSDGAARVRRVAALALESSATDAVIPQLAAALGDSEPAVYASAQKTLIARGAAAVGPLVARLGSANPREASLAEVALSRIGTPALPALFAALQSAAPVTRDSAAPALGDLGAPALTGLTRLLGDPAAPAPARVGAALALGRLGLPEAITPLATAARAPDPALRLAALRALARSRRPEGTSALVAGLADADRAVRLAALPLVQDWQIGDVDKQLTSLVGSGDELAKRLASIAMAAHLSPTASPVRGLTLGTPAAAEPAAATGLAGRLNQTAADATMPDLVRRQAILGLAYAGDAESVGVLGAFLASGQTYAALAAHSLGLLGAHFAAAGQTSAPAVQDAVARLMGALRQPQDEALRLQAAAGLSLMQGAPVPALLQELNGNDAVVQAWCAAVLGVLGKPANDPSMSEFGKNQVSRDWAAAALRLIANPQSVRFLARLPRNQQPPEDKVTAARALYDRIMDVRRTPVS